jgi:hypothetical protein
MEKYKALNDLISRFDPTKIVRIPDGPVLYWNLPERAPFAFLHQIHKGLSQMEFDTWEFQMEIPAEIVDFLFSFNGVNLFSSGITIFGFRDPRSNFRNKQWLPYRLEHYELADRPSTISPDFFIFGVANRSLQLLCYDKLSQRIHLVSKDNPAKSLRVFPTFEEFLSESIATLEKRFLEHNNNTDLTTALS